MTMGDLRTVRIGDFGRVVTGKTPLSSRPQLFGKTFPFLTPTDIDGAARYIEPERFLSTEGHDYQSRLLLPPHSVCVVCIGATIGKVCMTSRPSFTNQQVNSVIVNEEEHDPFFVYHLLTTLRDELKANAGGAATPIINKTAFSGIEVSIPPLLAQRRIAGILSAYEELIENGQRRIKALEAMARALYRETLQTQGSAAVPKPVVDCEYWRFIGENVGEYRDTKRYFATADVDGFAITGNGIEYSFSEKPSRAQKQPLRHSVWFARMKDTYKIAWYGVPNSRQAAQSLLSSGFAGFEARDPDLWPFLFLTISSTDFHVQKDLYSTGATQVSLTNEGLGHIEMPIPEEEAARRLGTEAGPMLNAILILQQRNDNLRRTRDLLLPRLLSGQIEVRPV